MALPGLKVEIALTSNPLDSPQVWTEPVSSTGRKLVRSFRSSSCHRTAALGRFDAGLMTVTFLNQERRLEPLNTASPYSPNVRTRKRIRATAIGASGTYIIATGYVESILPTWDPIHREFNQVITAPDAFRLFAGMPMQTPYALAVLADNPYQWWRLRESQGPNFADSSGVGGTAGGSPTGIAYNGPALVKDAAAKSVGLTGPSGNIQGFGIAGTVPFSVEIWYQTANVAAGSGFMMWVGNPVGPASEAYLAYFSSPNTVQFLANGSLASGAFNAHDGNIHHFVGTWDGTTARVYADGNLLGSAAGTPVTARSNAPWTIGDVQTTTGSYGEWALYLTTLSATRIAAHFNAGQVGWAGDTTDGRVSNILSAMGWDVFNDVDTDFGFSSLTDAGDYGSKKVLDALRDIDATEGGALFMAGDGKVTMRNRRAIQGARARSTTSQVTFGDADGEIRYKSIVLAFDDIELANRVEISRRNGITAVALDQAAITASGTPQIKTQNSVSNSDTDATNQATWLLNLLKNPSRWRIESLVVPLIDGDTTREAAVLGRLLWDRVTVNFTPPGGGSRISQTCLIMGIDHNIPGGNIWEVTLHLSGTDLNVTPFIVGTSFVGSTDVLVIF